MLAIFLAAVALVAFFLAKNSLTSQVDRLGSLVRSGILNRTVERLNVQLDEGGRCVTTLETVLVSVWTQPNVSMQQQQVSAFENPQTLLSLRARQISSRLLGVGERLTLVEFMGHWQYVVLVWGCTILIERFPLSCGFLDSELQNQPHGATDLIFCWC